MEERKSRAGVEVLMRRVLNFLLYVVLCFIVGTGLMMEWRLPPGSKGGHGLEVLGMGRHEWGEVHLWAGCVFVVLVLLHLWLARKWLVKIAVKKNLVLLGGGLGLGAAIIVGLLILPVTGR